MLTRTMVAGDAAADALVDAMCALIASRVHTYESGFTVTVTEISFRLFRLRGWAYFVKWA
jgi:hypothetical protein